MSDSLSRRQFVRWLGITSAGLLAACSQPAPAAQPTTAPTVPPAKPTAAPAPPAPAAPATQAPAGAAAPAQAAPAAAKPASGAGPADWDALLAAAKKEGKVVVQTPVGPGFRKALDEFTKSTGIEAEHQPFPDGATYVPKVTAERKAGIYSLDVAATTVPPLLQIFKPAGFLDPVRPVIVHPEALDDKAWFGGFESRWADTAKTHVFRHQISVARSVFLNTNLVKEDDIKSLDDLLDPKWKGKIVTSEVTQGYVYTPSIVIREERGEEWLKKLFVDQEPMMIRDRRQAIETLIRGGAPIGFGLHQLVMKEFKQQGLADHIANPDLPGSGYSSGDIIVVYNQAPHPNAAKLFANWILTKDGQIAWSTNTEVNSARVDVPVVDASSAPGKVTYTVPTNEDWLPKIDATQKFLKKLVV